LCIESVIRKPQQAKEIVQCSALNFTTNCKHNYSELFVGWVPLQNAKEKKGVKRFQSVEMMLNCQVEILSGRIIKK